MVRCILTIELDLAVFRALTDCDAANVRVQDRFDAARDEYDDHISHMRDTHRCMEQASLISMANSYVSSSPWQGPKQVCSSWWVPRKILLFLHWLAGFVPSPRTTVNFS